MNPSVNNNNMWSRVAASKPKPMPKSMPAPAVAAVKMAEYADDLQWGDIASNSVPMRPVAPIHSCVSPFELWKDMADEPGKYGDDILNWLDLDAEVTAAYPAQVAEYWADRDSHALKAIESHRSVWRSRMHPIARQAASNGMRRWIDRDIKALVSRVRARV